MSEIIQNIYEDLFFKFNIESLSYKNYLRKINIDGIQETFLLALERLDYLGLGACLSTKQINPNQYIMIKKAVFKEDDKLLLLRKINNKMEIDNKIEYIDSEDPEDYPHVIIYILIQAKLKSIDFRKITDIIRLFILSGADLRFPAFDKYGGKYKNYSKNSININNGTETIIDYMKDNDFNIDSLGNMEILGSKTLESNMYKNNYSPSDYNSITKKIDIISTIKEDYILNNGTNNSNIFLNMTYNDKINISFYEPDIIDQDKCIYFLSENGLNLLGINEGITYACLSKICKLYSDCFNLIKKFKSNSGSEIKPDELTYEWLLTIKYYLINIICRCATFGIIPAKHIRKLIQKDAYDMVKLGEIIAKVPIWEYMLNSKEYIHSFIFIILLEFNIIHIDSDITKIDKSFIKEYINEFTKQDKQKVIKLYKNNREKYIESIISQYINTDSKKNLLKISENFKFINEQEIKMDGVIFDGKLLSRTFSVIYPEQDSSVWCITSDSFDNVYNTLRNPYNNLSVPKYVIEKIRNNIKLLHSFPIIPMGVSNLLEYLYSSELPYQILNSKSDNLKLNKMSLQEKQAKYKNKYNAIMTLKEWNIVDYLSSIGERMLENYNIDYKIKAKQFGIDLFDYTEEEAKEIIYMTLLETSSINLTKVFIL